MRVDMWTDFACPACYLAKPRLTAAIRDTGHAAEIDVHYRAWELFPEATGEPFDSFAHVTHKFGGDEVQADRLERRMLALAQEQGQPYLLHHPVAKSFDAHRVLKLAAEYGHADAFLDRLQRDLFGRGVDTYHADYLAPLAIDLSVPATRVEALLAGTEYADDVRADQELGRELGVTAIPFTVLDGTQAVVGVVGVDGVDDLRNAIEVTFELAGSNR